MALGHDGILFLQSQRQERNRHMTPDIEKYLPMLDEFDITKEQKIQLIYDLWHIMENFVDYAFGLHPVQQVMNKNNQGDLQDSEKYINLPYSPKQNLISSEQGDSP